MTLWICAFVALYVVIGFFVVRQIEWGLQTAREQGTLDPRHAGHFKASSLLIFWALWPLVVVAFLYAMVRALFD